LYLLQQIACHNKSFTEMSILRTELAGQFLT
jgi:hypothetical protein